MTGPIKIYFTVLGIWKDGKKRLVRSGNRSHWNHQFHRQKAAWEDELFNYQFTMWKYKTALTVGLDSSKLCMRVIPLFLYHPTRTVIQNRVGVIDEELMISTSSLPSSAVIVLSWGTADADVRGAVSPDTHISAHGSRLVCRNRKQMLKPTCSRSFSPGRRRQGLPKAWEVPGDRLLKSSTSIYACHIYSTFGLKLLFEVMLKNRVYVRDEVFASVSGDAKFSNLNPGARLTNFTDEKHF